MASWIALRTAFAAPVSLRSSSSVFGRHAALARNAVANTRVRFISKAPPDPWRAFWNSTKMQPITFKIFEDACTQGKRDDIFQRSTAVDYFECAQAFIKAVQNGSSPGTTGLKDDPRFDAATIYETGCIVHSHHPTLSPIAVAMWASSSGLGFHPATITLVGDLVKRLRFGTLIMMRKVEADFRRIVAQGTDANALAIEALRLYRMEKKNAQATAMYKRALKLGGSNFSYKGKCHHGLGHIAHSEGRLEEAAQHLEEAHKVDPLGTGMLLGDIYTSIDPPRAGAVYYQSAIFGEPASFDRLADMELGMSMDATDPSTRSDHHLWALELQRLGNAKRAQLQALAAAAR